MRYMRILAATLALGCGCNDAPTPPPKPTRQPELTELATRSIYSRPDSVSIAYLHDANLFIGWEAKGKEIWRFHLPNNETPVGELGMAANSHFYVRSERTLYGFSRFAEILWRVELSTEGLEDEIIGPVPMPDSGVLVTTGVSRVAVFSPAGVEMWQLDLSPQRIRGSPVVAPNGTVILATSEEIVAITAGAIQWRRPLAGGEGEQ